MQTKPPIYVYRLVAAGFAALVPAFGFFMGQYHPAGTDPMWIRWVIAGWLVVVFGLTYLQRFDRMASWLMGGTAWGTTIWYVTLAVVNDYAMAYAIGLFLAVPAAGSVLSLVIDRPWHLRFFYVITGGVVGVTVPFSNLSTPLDIFYLGCVVTLLVIMDLTQESKLRTEAALDEHHRKYKSLFDDSNDAILVHDLDGRIMDANSKAGELFGCADDHLVGRSLFDLHPDESADVARRNLRALRDEQPFRTTAPYERTDGSVFWGDASANVIDLDSHMVGRNMIRDVTAWKEAQREQAQLAAIVRSSTSAIISTDLDGTIETWNTAAEELYGYSANEAIGRSLSMIVPPEEKGGFQDVVEAVRGGAQVSSLETVRQGKDGAPIEVMINISPVHNEAGDVVGMAGVIQDLTERRRTERQIRVQAAALESAGNAIVITDPEGTITWVNPAFTELTGYEYDEAVGETPKLLHSGEQDPSFYRELWETVLSGSVWHGELINECKDGTRYVEEQMITPVYGDTGEIHHFVAIKQDITDRKRRKEELIEAKETAEEMNRLKSSFLANMSHEIRTPLAAIIGYADLLQRQSSSSSDISGHVQQIQESGERLLNTLNSVLDLAQLESGALQPVPERFDAREELTGVARSLRIHADRKDLALRLDWPNEPLRVCMDKGILSRIATNLLHNAIKFTREGYVRIGCVRGPDGNGVVLEVEDTGIGIEDDFLEELFGPFRQESTGLNREYEGSGLGLTITHHLTELADGRLEVESEKGRGTTFTVYLPDTGGISRKKEVPSTRREEKTRDTCLPPNQTVLIVDDDPAVRDLLGEMLPSSYTIHMTGRPNRALEYGRNNSYDIILLDINLKDDLNGVQLLEQLREVQDLGFTVVMAITAYALPGDEERFMEAGFTGYLSKPFTRGDLQEMLGQYLTE
jgi:PAS domain S-box-containing protein